MLRKDIKFSFDGYIEQLKMIMSDLAIKDEKKAFKNENLESLQNFEIYQSARDEIDKFKDHDYTESELIEIGITDKEKINECMVYRESIPSDLQTSILKIKRRNIINNYVEKNNYYRQLYGLPDLEDEEYVYIDSSYKIPDNISLDPDTPIHLLDIYIIDVLEDKGIISDIKEKYKGERYKYLDYLGSRRVDFNIARLAKNYDLLRINKKVNDIIAVEYKKNFSIYRNYTMSVLFNNFYQEEYDYYPAFISLFIAFCSLQATLVYFLENIVSRDYVDNINYDVFLEAHSLEFLNGLPLNYKKILVKNFTYLTKYKGSSKVLVDVCELFGFKDIKLFKSYLYKHHSLDENNEPKFETIINEFGEEEPDYKYMYELFFVDIPYDSENVDLELAETSNRINYDDIAYRDNEWGGGEITKENLKQEILKKDFNYVLTKYISLKSMFNITELNFETSYFFNMIFKLRDQFKPLTLHLFKIHQDKLPLFDVIIYLYCLIMKKYNFKGDIISNLDTMLYVKGFDFNSDLSQIKEIASDLKLDINLDTFTVKTLQYNPQILDEIFFKCKDIRDYLIERMRQCNDIYEYKKLKLIYDSLMHTKLNSKMYKMSNGNVANTYFEMLEDLNPDLFYRLNNDITKETVVDEMTYILNNLDDYTNSGNFKYLFTQIELFDFERIKEYMFIILNFFKSYTKNLRDFNIIYVIDDKYYNFIKIIDRISISINRNLDIDLGLLVEIKDIISKFNVDEVILLKDYINETISLNFNTDIEFKESVQRLITRFTDINLKINDLMSLEVLNNPEEVLINSHNFDISLNEVILDLLEVVVEIYTDVNTENLDNIYIHDDVIYNTSLVRDNKIAINNIVKFIENIKISDKFNIREIFSRKDMIDIIDRMKLKDSITTNIILETINDLLSIKSSLNLFTIYDIHERINNIKEDMDKNIKSFKNIYLLVSEYINMNVILNKNIKLKPLLELLPLIKTNLRDRINITQYIYRLNEIKPTDININLNDDSFIRKIDISADDITVISSILNISKNSIELSEKPNQSDNIYDIEKYSKLLNILYIVSDMIEEVNNNMIEELKLKDELLITRSL